MTQTMSMDSGAKPIGPVPYVVAAMSILPGLGVIFGLAAIVWGFLLRKRGGKVVAILGAVGFAGQSLFFVFLLHFLVG